MFMYFLFCLSFTCTFSVYGFPSFTQMMQEQRTHDDMEENSAALKGLYTDYHTVCVTLTHTHIITSHVHCDTVWASVWVSLSHTHTSSGCVVWTHGTVLSLLPSLSLSLLSVPHPHAHSLSHFTFLFVSYCLFQCLTLLASPLPLSLPCLALCPSCLSTPSFFSLTHQSLTLSCDTVVPP